MRPPVKRRSVRLTRWCQAVSRDDVWQPFGFAELEAVPLGEVGHLPRLWRTGGDQVG